MEGDPSISWQYFHKLEGFHLFAFGYNYYYASVITAVNLFLNVAAAELGPIQLILLFCYSTFSKCKLSAGFCLNNKTQGFSDFDI